MSNETREVKNWTKIVKRFNDGSESIVAIVSEKDKEILNTIKKLSPVIMNEPDMTVIYQEQFEFTSDDFIRSKSDNYPNDAEFGAFMRSLINKK